MATKKFIKSVLSATYSPYPISWGEPWVTQTRQNYDEAVAVFTRVRPSPLTPTGITVLKRTYNPQTKPHRYGGETFLDFNVLIRRNDPPAWSADVDGLLVKSKAKMTGRIMDLGESLTGLPSLGRSIASHMDRLSRFFDSARKGKVKEMRRAGMPSSLAEKVAGHSRQAKRVSSAYLEGMFAWLPIANDLFAALSAYEKLARQGDYSRSSSTDSSSDGRRSTRVGVGGTVQSSFLRNLNQLGLANPASTTWQNLPLSFLADWGGNVGQVFAALSAEVGLKGFGAWKIDSDTTLFECKVQEVWTVYCTDLSIRRVPIGTAVPALDSLRIKPVQTSVTKALLGAALLHQALHR